MNDHRDHAPHDPLDELLAERPIGDEGFTDRVMARLPPKRRAVPRALVLGGAATLGTLFAALSPGATRIAAMVRVVFSSPASASSSSAIVTHATAALVLAAIAVVLVGAGAQIATND